MRASEGEAKNTLLYSSERSPKISSALYKDSQYVLENMQVVTKFFSAWFCLREKILAKMATTFSFMHINADVLSV